MNALVLTQGDLKIICNRTSTIFVGKYEVVLATTAAAVVVEARDAEREAREDVDEMKEDVEVL